MNQPSVNSGNSAVIWDIKLTKSWGKLKDQRQFTLNVQFSSIASKLVLLGPSGSGKSQTVKMIAGLVQPDAGRIGLVNRTLFDSHCGLVLAPQERQLGYVFQDYALFPHLNVRQNIAFGLQTGAWRIGDWRNPPRDVVHDAVNYWLNKLDLQSVASLYPAQLSGGQRQRTAIARALVTEPKALLLDEPFAALDRPLRQRLRDELNHVQQTLGLPVLLITHDEDDVAHFADEVVMLENGCVVRD